MDDALVVSAKTRGPLKVEEVVAVHALLRQGYSEQEVAELLGRSTALITKARTEVRSLMHTLAMEQMGNWRRANAVASEKGYYQGSKEWLESIGVIDRPQGGHGGNVMTVQILNNAGQSVGLPGLPPPTINVKE